jgi:hypothetical protein
MPSREEETRPLWSGKIAIVIQHQLDNGCSTKFVGQPFFLWWPNRAMYSLFCEEMLAVKRQIGVIFGR